MSGSRCGTLLPCGLCDWFLTQANNPAACELIEKTGGRLLIRVQGRDDAVGDLGADLVEHMQLGGTEPRTLCELVSCAFAVSRLHGRIVSSIEVERAARESIFEFARYQRLNRT